VRHAVSPIVALLMAVQLGGCASRTPTTVNPVSAMGAGTVESHDAALSASILAEKLAPSAEAHLHVAREYVRLGILDFAHERVQRALEREPQFAAAHELMARIWRDWGQPGAALVHAHRAIHYAPGSSSARNTLGTVLDTLGRVSEARGAYQRAVALDAQAGWALNNLCYLEFRQGRFEEARAHCEAALRAMPHLTQASNNLGLTYAASGDMTGAASAFMNAGDSASAHYNLGIVHMAARDYVGAAAAFEAALAARPGFTAAKTRAHEARMRAIKGVDRNES
jgi:protein O-GlcNAc transferase